MYKTKSNNRFLNTRNIPTRLHDAPRFKTEKPNCEKYKANVFYAGAVMWNGLPVRICNIDTYNLFKDNQKKWAIINQP